MTRLLVTVKSHMPDAQWLSAVPVLLGYTWRVPKWKGLQYLMCGTVQCVKLRVQKVEQNLGQGKQGAGNWQVRLLLQETCSDRWAVKRSLTDLWGNKVCIGVQIWQEEACDKNHLWNAKFGAIAAVSTINCVKNIRVIHKDFYQCYDSVDVSKTDGFITSGTSDYRARN